MTNINTILKAIRSTSLNKFHEMFKPSISSLSGDSYQPWIVDLIEDAKYDIWDTEELINITLMDSYLSTSNMYQFLTKSYSVCDCMFKFKNKIPFEQSLNIKQVTSCYVAIYEKVHEYLCNNPEKYQIEQSFLLNINISMNEKQSWARSLSDEDRDEYLQFANTLISKLDIKQILYWLETYPTNPILAKIIPELDIYKAIPPKDLEIYKVLGLSDAQCCAMYREQSQNKKVEPYPLVEFDFN